MSADRRIASIVLPTLKESVAQPLATLGAFLATLDGWRFEILVVDDSPDDFLATVQSAIDGVKLEPTITARLVAGPRTGKGGAVRRGVAQAAGSVIFIIDCDLPVSLHHVPRFLELIDEGADVVMAERPSGRNKGRPVRVLFSLGLRLTQQLVVFQGQRFSDTQCGFKAYRGDLAREIARDQVVDGGMCDLEYLYVADKRGAKIVAVSVVANPEVRESRVNLWKCLRRDPIDVLRIKLFAGRHR